MPTFSNVYMHQFLISCLSYCLGEFIIFWGCTRGGKLEELPLFSIVRTSLPKLQLIFWEAVCGSINAKRVDVTAVNDNKWIPDGFCWLTSISILRQLKRKSPLMRKGEWGAWKFGNCRFPQENNNKITTFCFLWHPEADYTDQPKFPIASTFFGCQRNYFKKTNARAAFNDMLHLFSYF